MTRTEAVEAINKAEDDSHGTAHEMIDGILIKVLEEYGFSDVVEAYWSARSRIEFWFE